jgi:succinate dehydrogenase/fumarate reductase flavoprotein subunit
METQTLDVVVAGCGVAGLSAAVSAAENGAKVTILERVTREERGGQSRYTEAYLRMKSEAEVSDDFETMLAENGSGYIDPELVAEAANARTNLAKSLAIADPTVLETVDIYNRSCGIAPVSRTSHSRSWSGSLREGPAMSPRTEVVDRANRIGTGLAGVLVQQI